MVFFTCLITRRLQRSSWLKSLWSRCLGIYRNSALVMRWGVKVLHFCCVSGRSLICFSCLPSLCRPNYQRSTVGQKRSWRFLYYQTLCLIILFSEMWNLSLAQPHISGPCQNADWLPPWWRAGDLFTQDDGRYCVLRLWRLRLAKQPSRWSAWIFSTVTYAQHVQCLRNDPITGLLLILIYSIDLKKDRCPTMTLFVPSCLFCGNAGHFMFVIFPKSALLRLLASHRYSCASYPNTTNVYLASKGPVGKSVPWVLRTEESLLALDAAYSCFDLCIKAAASFFFFF